MKVSSTVLKTNGVGDNLVEFNRSCQDVQQGIFNNLSSNGLTKRVLELDIQKCFDAIDHKFIMRSIQLPRAAKIGLFRAIKAGVKGEFLSSESGNLKVGQLALYLPT